MFKSVREIETKPTFRPRPVGIEGYHAYGSGEIDAFVSHRAESLMVTESMRVSPNEAYGYLIGRAFRDQRGEYVVITDAVPARNAERNRSHVKTTVLDEQILAEALLTRHPTTERVGWWHSHPNLHLPRYSGPDHENQAIQCGENFQIGLLVCLDEDVATIHAFRGPKSHRMETRSVAQPRPALITGLSAATSIDDVGPQRRASPSTDSVCKLALGQATSTMGVAALVLIAVVVAVGARVISGAVSDAVRMESVLHRIPVQEKLRDLSARVAAMEQVSQRDKHEQEPLSSLGEDRDCEKERASTVAEVDEATHDTHLLMTEATIDGTVCDENEEGHSSAQSMPSTQSAAMEDSQYKYADRPNEGPTATSGHEVMSPSGKTSIMLPSGSQDSGCVDIDTSDVTGAKRSAAEAADTTGHGSGVSIEIVRER